MSYKVDVGYRKLTFSFETSEEASRFNEEYFRKTKILGSISTSDEIPVYQYTKDGKLIKKNRQKRSK